jgi:ribonucleoside-diphosphate reductase alpha chain
MREKAISVNARYAKKMGINPSAAITTQKPSGTASQLVNSASGGHARHSKYGIRTVRMDNKDPLTQMLKDFGVPNEPDVMKPNDTTVFSFPYKAPEGAVTREDFTAIEALGTWLTYKKNWTEHNPSVTVSVREHEWIEVANWVYENWDDVGGISFLPYSEHTYKQAPYQEITEAEYYLALADMPTDIDWSMLSAYEFEDTTTGVQELSCTAGNCEIVGSA